MPLSQDLTTFTTSSQAVASYDFTDIVSGTGYITLYAGNTDGGYFLSNIQYFSNQKQLTSEDIGIVSDSTIFDLDYDVLLQKSITIKGDVLVTVAHGSTQGGGGTIDTYVIATLRKWDGTTETDLGSVTMDTNQNTSGIKYGLNTGEINIASRTTIKEGDTLRLNIVVKATTTINSAQDVHLLNDPKGRTVGTAESSQLTVLIPTPLDI